MRSRKLLSALLTLSLTLALAAPALAADAADQRLAQVTLAVKRVLEVEDDFTQFYGEPNETTLGTRWSLSWSDEEGKSLSVTCTDTGKLLSMRRYTPSVWVTREGHHFPVMTPDKAREIAVTFARQVLEEGETARITSSSEPTLDATQYSFWATVDLNGLPTPMSFTIRVDLEQGEVTYFQRGDQSSYVGEVPAPATVTTAQAARAQLASTLNFELIYVYDAQAGQAVLRYVPRSSDEYYVDAATGALIDLTELRGLLTRDSGRGDDLSYDAIESSKNQLATPEAAPTLTPAELEGVAKLEGVLTQEELTAKVKAWSELGLGDFEATACSYTVERTDPNAPPTDQPAKVTAQLTLTRVSDGRVARRTVTMDARTGQLTALSGYDPYSEEPVAVDLVQAQAKAEAFLAKLWPAQAAKSQLYQSSAALWVSGAHSFTFAQMENGYFYPTNSLRVSVSARDGSIMGFSKSFDDTVTFDDAQDLIHLSAAQTAWAASFDVSLRYLEVPVALDPLGEEVTPLKNAGYSYYNALKPGYLLGDREVWSSAVDAKTGQLVGGTSGQAQQMTYDDLAGHWAQAAMEELALYSIGWYGGKAAPDQVMTQLEYIAFLASVDGYRFQPGDDPESIYSYAYRKDLITEAQRDEDRALTKADMVAMFLNSLGYKTVANLPGIFRCDYTDAAAIPAGHLGYAALAQAFRLVVGDENGNYCAARAATRGEAAVMLWKYLSR